MKLVELLARDLDKWADTTLCYTQDVNGRVYPWLVTPYFKDGEWFSTGGDIDGNLDAELVHGEICSDFDTVIITKELWLEEKQNES